MAQDPKLHHQSIALAQSLNNLAGTGKPMPDEIPTAKSAAGVGDAVPKSVFAQNKGIFGMKSLAEKPLNFFELLAAAAKKAKLEQNKGPAFLEYLKDSGVKTAWVRAVVGLYEEKKKPDDPQAYILKLMGLGIPDLEMVKGMQEKVRELRRKVLDLQGDNEQLRFQVEEEEAKLALKNAAPDMDDSDKLFSDYNSDEYETPKDNKGTC